ncbi:MAG: PEP-CTERM sorting domain-containing protein [Steroidobacteraceae bacterium]
MTTGEYGNFVTTPGPDTLMLLGAGVLGLIAITQRRRRKSPNSRSAS